MNAGQHLTGTLLRGSAMTPSLVFDTPSGDSSPSRVTKTQSLFTGWTNRAKVVEIKNPPLEVTNQFDQFYRLAEVPSALAYGPLPTPVFDNEAEFQLSVKSWASESTLHKAEGDEYGIMGLLPTLALAYSHVRKTSNNRSNENAQRRGIDDIINLAFSARVDRHCDFRTGESYRLTELNGNPDALSDTLVTIPSTTVNDKIQIHRLTFTDPTVVDHLYWSTGGMVDGFSIIGFAGEFKKDDDDHNKNQLIMVLTTAQAQRKALSLKEAIIMGAITCRGHVQIFSSFWASDRSALQIYAHEQQFNLSNPIQVIQLYVFFSRLERHIRGTFALELTTWRPPTEIVLQDLMWRSPNQIRKHRRTGTVDSSDRTNGGRAVQVRGDHEVA